MFTSITTESYGTSAEKVINRLQEVIHQGVLQPGERLPSERDLVKRRRILNDKANAPENLLTKLFIVKIVGNFN